MISVNLVPPESILVSTIAKRQQQVKSFAFNNDSEYIYSGVIDCTIVNKVAADFLATQITKYY